MIVIITNICRLTNSKICEIVFVYVFNCPVLLLILYTDNCLSFFFAFAFKLNNC